MPVPEQPPVKTHTGNGVATTFAYTFKIFADADLKVTVDGVFKTLTTDYTVTGAGQGGGGNVVFVNPPAADAAIVVYRAIAYKRDTDYVEGGDFLAQTVDDDMDRVVMLIQQLNDDKNRAMKMPKGETADQVITENASARANKVLGFDDSGNVKAKSVADLGDSVTIGDGLQKVGTDLRVAADVVRDSELNIFPQTADLITDFVVSGLLGSDPGASLTMTIPGGTAYVIGKRVVKSGADADLTKTYTASKDTYVDLSNAGAITYSEVANGAAAPAVAANSIRLQKVVTNGTEITGVTDLRVLIPKAAAHAKTIFANNYALAGTNTYTLDIPGYTGYTAGDIIFAKVVNANGVTAPTINISSLGTKTVKKEGSAALAVGDMPAGHEGIFRYNGTDMILLNPKGSAAGFASTYAHAYRSAALAISQNVTTKINLDAESYDPGGNMDVVTNFRYNVPSTGVYFIDGGVDFVEPFGDGLLTTVHIYLNGASIGRNQQSYGYTNSYPVVRTPTLWYLTAGDYVELYVLHAAGEVTRALDVGTNTKNYLRIIRTS